MTPSRSLWGHCNDLSKFSGCDAPSADYPINYISSEVIGTLENLIIDSTPGVIGTILWQHDDKGLHNNSMFCPLIYQENEVMNSYFGMAIQWTKDMEKEALNAKTR